MQVTADEQIPQPRATFTDMKESTAADFEICKPQMYAFATDLPSRVMAHMQLLEGATDGYAVDRLTHCLQTAALAESAGKSDDYVLCALIHDIGDTLGSFNHQDIAAAILKPFVPENLHWMIAHHAEFQGQYFFEHLGLDPRSFEQYLGSPFFDLTQEFVSEYDSPAFDPHFDTPPLEHYAPLIKEMMTLPRYSIYKVDE